MIGNAIGAIFFLCTLVLFIVSSLAYALVASHYFLTTLTDSSSGRDEVYFPREGITDWWWKPVLCGWVFVAWLIPATLLLLPIAALAPLVYIIVWSLVLWFAYPLSLASSLYAQSWLVLVHRGVIGRMLHHVGAFIYVQLATFAITAGSIYLILRGADDIAWLIPAVLLVPLGQLLYARHWGRFAWLSLNFLPRHAIKKRGPGQAESGLPREFPEEEECADSPPPELTAEHSAEEVEAAAAEAFREGLPAGAGGGVKPAPMPRVEPPPKEPYDEWNDREPYTVIGDAEEAFAEKATAPKPAQPGAPPPKPAVVEEEEDEWATDKKPYAMTEPAPETGPDCEQTTENDADKPLVMSKYYAERRRKEAEEQRRREEEMRKMPPRSKKTPTFASALLGGVWAFLFYPSTLLAWGNLAVFTLVEFLLLYVLVMFAPMKK